MSVVVSGFLELGPLCLTHCGIPSFKGRSEVVALLAQRRCASLDELCHNEMSRDHDAPVEYCENSLR